MTQADYGHTRQCGALFVKGRHLEAASYGGDDMGIRPARLSRSLVVGSVLAVSASSFSLSPARGISQPEGVSCGDTIVGAVRLTTDLTNCPDNGVVIGADNVTLDLNGHVIDGDATPFASCPADSSCGLGIDNSAGHRGLSLRDGTVRGFGVGVVLGAGATRSRVRDVNVGGNALVGLFAESSDGITIARSSFRRNGVSGVVVVDSDGVRISRNFVTNSSGFGVALMQVNDSEVRRNHLLGNQHGIAVQEGSSRNLVRGNIIAKGGGSSIDIGGGDATDNRIVRNRLTDNGDGIIMGHARNTVIARNVVRRTGFSSSEAGGFPLLVDGSRSSTVTRNAITGSRGPAIWVTSLESTTPAANTRLWRNTVDRSLDDGIRVDQDAIGTQVHRNSATRNGDDGIDADAPGTTLTRNRATNNVDLGIEAVRGVVDGGGNTAHDNGDKAQCRNVDCS